MIIIYLVLAFVSGCFVASKLLSKKDLTRKFLKGSDLREGIVYENLAAGRYHAILRVKGKIYPFHFPDSIAPGLGLTKDAPIDFSKIPKEFTIKKERIYKSIYSPTIVRVIAR